jgi:hypothetical protein
MSSAVRSVDGTVALTRVRRRVGDAAAARSYPTELWGRRDVVQAVVLSAVGLVLMAVAWYGSGDGRPFDRQVPFIDLAVGGLMIAVVGGGLFLLTGLRAVSARKAAVKVLVAQRAAERVAGSSGHASDALVAGADMTRFHRSGCSLVTGKAVAATTLAEHEQAGRRPCGLCFR